MDEGKKHLYDHSDLKELMDNTGGWANNWDDVLFYLNTEAPYDADFTKSEVNAIIEDVKKLKEQKFPFTTDYRQIWHTITGEETKDLPPPEGIKTPPTNPIELAKKYFVGLNYPATKAYVLKVAESNQAPPRVMNVLKRVEDKNYTDLGSLIEAVGDLTWDHD